MTFSDPNPAMCDPSSRSTSPPPPKAQRKPHRATPTQTVPKEHLTGGYILDILGREDNMRSNMRYVFLQSVYLITAGDASGVSGVLSGHAADEYWPSSWVCTGAKDDVVGNDR